MYSNSNLRTLPEQMEFMISFMEQNGDLGKHIKGGPLARIEQLQKWNELTILLNKAGNGPPKECGKWKKVWSDLKNNTKKKYHKLKTTGLRTSMTPLDLRVLKLVGVIDEDGNANQIDNDEDEEENIIQIEPKKEIQPFESTPYFFTPTSQNNKDNLDPNRRPSTSSSSDTSSSEPRSKRKKTNNIESLTNKYLDFERKREEMMHEREMAKMKQEEHRLELYSRLVDVFESLAPAVRKFLERD